MAERLPAWANRNVPVAEMDTEPGAHAIVFMHNWGDDTEPRTRDSCCAFCADELRDNPVWFAAVVNEARRHFAEAPPAWHYPPSI
jgi:hypothetical protein